MRGSRHHRAQKRTRTEVKVSDVLEAEAVDVLHGAAGPVLILVRRRIWLRSKRRDPLACNKPKVRRCGRGSGSDAHLTARCAVHVGVVCCRATCAQGVPVAFPLSDGFVFVRPPDVVGKCLLIVRAAHGVRERVMPIYAWEALCPMQAADAGTKAGRMILLSRKLTDFYSFGLTLG